MIKLGMLDFDTSHVVQFSKRLNKKGIDEDQWVDGAEVVVGCPGTSTVFADRIPKFTKVVSEEVGVPLVEKPEEMIGKIDGILIESNDASVHLDRARPFIEAGIPAFIDKPLTWSAADAEALLDLAGKKNVPVFSASSLRYDENVQSIKADQDGFGAPVAVETYGPQNIVEEIPGWFFYGIHSVEMAFELLGPGYGEFSYVKGEGAERATSVWKNGAIGTVTLMTQGEKPFGFSYFGQKKALAARADSKYMYRELLKRIVEFFRTGKQPISSEEMIQVVRCIEEVNKVGAA